MSRLSPAGVILISVDLESGTDPGAAVAGRSVESFIERLIEVFRRHELPATWNLANPAESPWPRRLNRALGSHDLGIWCDGTWLDSPQPRASMSLDLARRVHAVERITRTVHSAVLPDVSQSQNLDLLGKFGIGAVRSSSMVRRESATAEEMQLGNPQRMKHGLWRMESTLALPWSRGWLAGLRSQAELQQQLKAAVHGGAVRHIAVSAPALAARGNYALALIDRFLADVSRQRRQGRIESLDLAQSFQRLAEPRTAQPARSILRHAA